MDLGKETGACGLVGNFRCKLAAQIIQIKRRPGQLADCKFGIRPDIGRQRGGQLACRGAAAELVQRVGGIVSGSRDVVLLCVDDIPAQQEEAPAVMPVWNHDPLAGYKDKDLTTFRQRPGSFLRELRCRRADQVAISFGVNPGLASFASMPAMRCRRNPYQRRRKISDSMSSISQ